MKLKIGSKLFIIREERRLTQAEMADLLCMPISSYSRIERNENSVEIDKVLLFASALQVPVNELLPETLAINNNHHSLGNGGGIVFGNQYFYNSESEALKALQEENWNLQRLIESMRSSG